MAAQKHNKCSFCGRSEKDVPLLLTGINGYICSDCAMQAYQIVQENIGLRTSGSAGGFGLKDIPKPRQIKEYLDCDNKPPAGMTTAIRGMTLAYTRRRILARLPAFTLMRMRVLPILHRP